MSKVEELREELRNLSVGYLQGDVPKRKFERLRAEKSVEFYRAIVAAQLAEDEEILGEHHVARAHLKLSQSMLKEPAEEVISLFLTDRRLLRLRSILNPNQIITGDSSDHTMVDGMRIADIAGLRVRTELRLSEAIAGLIICAIAALFHPWLLMTGTFLFAVGLLGIFHGLFMPTRWMELEVRVPRADDIIRIYGIRKKSARKLLRSLREHMRASPGATEENE